jgi:hypothetical protein
MSAWILIVAWGSVQTSTTNPDHMSLYTSRSNAIAMQEFGDLKACQHASVEAKKIAQGIRVVCVPKGGAA